ncbi:anthranilate phosphoribosyltransferase [Heliorestis convoluta]|uniref:Anthranilate phosphoribosyltransferase n=1 Tax=Heliorestis convoluta TaxID=356322 RepID=A0A5Q2N564_9FIRM|nr:anthranilate phosphoribosyltransferase [Heliorestis convoluta]QGG47725.1 anthranilate phosphoribosyltransferase [Heliorestis convoluta]
MSHLQEDIARESLLTLLDGELLGEKRAESLMNAVMEGKVPPIQLAGILVALRFMGEREEELTGLARAMRNRVYREMTPFVPANYHEIKDSVVDTCGTGGDGAGTFNISTATAMVVAAAGVPVAKHGNRAVSGKAGSADVLEALGLAVDCSPEKSFQCLMKTGFGFFFAPQCHRAMAHAGPVRRELGVPTLFNLLGPLTNPAGAKRQLVGVNRPERVELMARVLRGLGVTKACVVHGHGGLDELTLTGPSQVAFLKEGEIENTLIDPKDYGFSYCHIEEVTGGTKEENAAILEKIFYGEKGPQRDIVVLNAGATFYVADIVSDLREGIALAEVTIDSGNVIALLQKIRTFMQ